MYEKYWGLEDKPFRNTADPKYLYLSSQHEEALARLKYGISESLGCVALCGVFGCGKTLLLNSLFGELEKGRYKTAFLANPQLSPLELLSGITDKLGISLPGREDKAGFLRLIDKAVNDNYNDGKHTVIVIDEAHVINSEKAFEELRMLLNFQRDQRFLVSLVLSGQPELARKINNIKQLAQRVGIKAHLDRMNEEETSGYIKYRLKVAGADRPLFGPGAIRAVFKNSGGIPRRINSICDLSLLSGSTSGAEKIGEDIVDEVVKDLI